METTAAEAIRLFAARQYIEPARQKGEKRVQISAGDVHSGLRLKNRVPNVCSALSSRIFLERNCLTIEAVSGPPSGMGTRVVYTYRLLENEHPTEKDAAVFGNLRGLLKDTLHKLGGGEAYLRREREGFYQSDRMDNE